MSLHLVALGGDDCEGSKLLGQTRDGALFLGDERGEAGNGVSPTESQRLAGGLGEVN